MAELELVVHGVLVDNISDSLLTTIWGCGVAALLLAASQLVANTVLLVAALTSSRRMLPNPLLTRIFFLSTFWGCIDAYRKTLSLDELSVFLV